jgi:drug/metabolite transporter (DMT)-like permease
MRIISGVEVASGDDRVEIFLVEALYTALSPSLRALEHEEACPHGQQVAGDAITLLGAFFYACYTLLFRLLFPDGDDSVDMTFVFG